MQSRSADNKPGSASWRAQATSGQTQCVEKTSKAPVEARRLQGNQTAHLVKPIAEQFQDIFDWASYANNAFTCADFVHDVYHQFQRTGRLTSRQEATVHKIASLKAVRQWHLANPTLKGRGLPPPQPEPEGCLIMDDDDDA